MRGGQAAREVDYPEALARVGIVDRSSGASPFVHGLGEVLGREDLDRMVDGERGAHRVGPDGLFGPGRSDGELDSLGPVEDVGIALDPQDRAVRVA